MHLPISLWLVNFNQSSGVCDTAFVVVPSPGYEFWVGVVAPDPHIPVSLLNIISQLNILLTIICLDIFINTEIDEHKTKCFSKMIMKNNYFTNLLLSSDSCVLSATGKRSPRQESSSDLGLTPLISPRKRRPPSTSDDEKENFAQPRIPSSTNKSRIKITPSTPCKA